MSGNYPPGVTGFEPQIVGYDDADEEECEQAEATCDWCGWLFPVDALQQDIDWRLCPGCWDRLRNPEEFGR